MNKLSNKPLYDQVFDQIKDMIRSGTYCAGDQLPSEKELMERMGQILGDECQAENVGMLLGPS